MKRFTRLFTWGGLALALGGCVLAGDKLDQFRWHFVTAPFFVFDNAQGYQEPPQTPVMDESVNVAIAISGGGSRSAVLAAGIMEQLAQIPNSRTGGNVLDSVEVVSGVSGGSLAAAYYGLYKPAKFDDPQKTTEFFQQFKSHMTVDLFMRGWVHYLSHPWEGAMKYYSRYRMVQSLANTMDQYVFHGANFGHLQEREACGESPIILLNSASLDTGSKFIFTNLNVQKRFAVNPDKLGDMLPSLAPSADVSALGILAQSAGSPIFCSYGFDSIDSDISTFRLASAVAASSSYPILPGPSALFNYVTNGYVHLADGGANDNFGIDSIVQLHLNRLQTSGKRSRLVVISIDATTPLIPQKEGDPNGYVSAISYGARASTAMATRGQTLATAILDSQRTIRVIPLRLAECGVSKELYGEIASYCISESDMYKVLGAATELVQKHGPEIEEALRN